MSKSDEFYRKLMAQENESGNSSTQKSDEFYQKLMGVTLDDSINKVNAWIDGYNAAVKGVVDYDTSRNGRYTSDVSGGFGSEIDRLIGEYSENKSLFDGFELGDAYTQLKELRETIREGNAYMESFGGEDRYYAGQIGSMISQWVGAGADKLNKHAAAVKEQHRGTTREIDVVKKDLDNANSLLKKMYAKYPTMKHNQDPEQWEKAIEAGYAPAESLDILNGILELEKQKKDWESEYRWAQRFAEEKLENEMMLEYAGQEIRDPEEVQSDINLVDECLEVLYEKYPTLKDEKVQDMDLWIEGVDAGLTPPWVLEKVEQVIGFQNYRKELESELERSQYYAYIKLTQNPDFAEKSVYKPQEKKLEEPTFFEAMFGITDPNGGYEDPLYEHINGNENASAVIMNKAADFYGSDNALGGIYGRVADSKTEARQMEPEEVAIFNYLYATQGPEAAYEYYEYLESDLYRRQRKAEQERLSAYAKEKPGEASLSAIALAPFKGLSYVGQVSDYILDGEIDENAPYNSFSYYGTTIQNAVTEKIKENEKWGGVGSFTYNIGMSLGTFLASTIAAGGSPNTALAIMGSGAAADQTIAAKDRGLSDDQAFALGTIAGLTEIATEKIGLDALLDTALLSSSARNYIIKNALAEAGEEGLSNFANTIGDIIVSKDKSEWNQSINAYIDQNYSKEGAFAMALADQAAELGLDMLAGGFSGGFMGSVSVGGNYIANKIGGSTNSQAPVKPVVEQVQQTEAVQQPSLDIDPDSTQGQIIRNMTGEQTVQEAPAQTQQGTTQTQPVADIDPNSPQGQIIRNMTGEDVQTQTVGTREQQEQVARLSKITRREVVLYEGKSYENGYFDRSDGKIYVNVNGVDPVVQIFSHELTHSTEGAKVYNDLKTWVFDKLGQSGKNLAQMKAEKTRLYESRGIQLDSIGAEQEIVAEYISQNLLTNEQVIMEVCRSKPTVARQILNWIDRFLSKLGVTNADRAALEHAKILYAKALNQTQSSFNGQTAAVQPAQGTSQQGTADNAADWAELEDFRNKARQSLEAGDMTEAEYDQMMDIADEWEAQLMGKGDTGLQHSISEIKGEKADYGIGVILDTDIFEGVHPRAWGKVLGNYVYQKLAGKTMIVYDVEGNPETIHIARKTDRVKKEGARNSHKVLDELARYRGDNIRALATVHLSEVLQVSKYENATGEHEHQWMDENGWEYRRVYLQDVNGNIYTAVLNIANGRDRRILYSINMVERIDQKKRDARGVVSSTENGRDSHTMTASPETNVAQPEESVKQYSISNTSSKQDVVSGLKDILRRGGDLSELRQFVAQVEQSTPRMEQKAPRADQNTREAERILESAKQQGISVEEYLSQNWELYETESGWDPAARKALELEKADSRQYSFAGRGALSADDSLLATAEQMRREGADDETIRQQTGWFVGKDGMWRFEIDDSQMELSDTIHNYMQLGELIQHDKLFAAYPDLAYIQVTFENLPAGTYASYNRQFDSISVSSKLTDPGMADAAKDALIHEIQHAIQNREGFTAGATVEGWNRKIERGFDSRRSQDIRKAQETEQKLAQIRQEQPEFYQAMIELEAMTPTVPRGEIDWNTLEQIEEDPPEWQAFDARREALEEQYGDMEVWDFMDLLYQRERLAKLGRSGAELYYNTAGEIEARNVESRRSYTEEQRKNNPPRLGGEDTVLVEGDAKADSYVGVTAGGIEVYQTSKNTQNLSYTDRIHRALDLMNNQFYGRTAKFTAAGQTYYAKFDSSDLGKNLYGDNKSDNHGQKAKINVAAEGNLFELVENARFTRNAPEKGKKTKGHIGVQSWDYFYKTVQIDNRVYDLIINVRKKANGEFVYSVQLNENKTIAPAPPLAPTSYRDESQYGYAQNEVLTDATTNVPQEELGVKQHSVGDTQTEAEDQSIDAPTAREQMRLEGAKQAVEQAAEEAGLEIRDLLAFHNIRADQLMDVLRRGVLIRPSFAVTNKAMASFGEITLLFDRATIDPETGEVALYGADAWTPAQTELKINAQFDETATAKTVEQLKETIGKYYSGQLLDITPESFMQTIRNYDGSIYDAFAHHLGFQTAYALEVGIIEDLPANNLAMVDEVALEMTLKETLDTDEGWRQYKGWLNRMSDALITEYDRASNAEVLRNMRKQPATAKPFRLSVNGELVVPAVEYSSVEQARQNRNRLAENAAELTRQVAEEFLAWAQNIGDNTQAVVDTINNAYVDRYSTEGIADTFREAGMEISQQQAQRLQELYKKTVELPTEYFEAKPMGEVGLDKIRAIVLPEGVDTNLRAELENLGVPIVEYGKQVGRAEAVRSFDDLKFSISEEGSERLEESVDEEDGNTAREQLPRKAQEYLKRAERKLLRDIAGVMNAHRFADRSYLQEIVSEISEEYLKTGTVSQDTLDNLFAQAYTRGVVVDSEFYNQFKEVKDYLRTMSVTLAEGDTRDIADWHDFRSRANKHRVLRIVSEGGLPVDTAYGELHTMAPGLFPENITHPADQLLHMYEVGKSITISEKSLREYHNADAETFRSWAKRDFESVIGDVMKELRTVKRVGDEKAARDAEETEKIPITQEDAANAYAELKQARRTYEKAMAKNLLSESDEMQVGRLLKSEILPEHLDESQDNVKGILAVYEAKKDYERLCGIIGEYKRHRKGELRQLADSYLQNAGEWVDKKVGLLYSRETMRRNIQDIVKDQKEAAAINDEFFDPIQVAEAASTRFKTEYRDRVRELKLSTKVRKGDTVSEAHAVQLLGEVQDNIRVLENAKGRIRQKDGKTLAEWRAVIDEMWQSSPSLDKGKIEGAVREFRYIYDKLFQQMNEVRVRNGYEPVNYRKGYFPHFQPGGDGIIALFGKALGISTEVNALPTTINGLTHTFKPGIQWFGNAQERLGFNTAYDAVEGFDKYIEGVASVIHQTDNIQKLRALAAQVRYRTTDEGIRQQVDEVLAKDTLTEEEKQARINEIYEHGRFSLSNFVVELDEYTNLLANKKSKLDRTVEGLFGRRIYKLMKWLGSRFGANMIVGNLGSALTNFIPLTQASAQLDRFSLLRGMWSTLQSYRHDDGIVGMSTFLTNRLGSDPLIKGWLEKLSEIKVIGLPLQLMEMIDTFTSGSIVRAAYFQNLRRGLSEAEAMHQADIFAASVMADRSKGSMPTLFESTNPLFKAFTQFQLEVNNQFSEVFKDLPRNYGKKGAAILALTLLRYFLGTWLFDEAYEYLIGRRPALDPIDILNSTVGDLTGYELPNILELGEGIITGEMPSLEMFETEKVGFGKAMTNLATEVAEDLPFSSIFTDGGRIPVASAIPNFKNLWNAATDTEKNGKKRWKEAQTELNKLAYIVPPFGGNQISKIWKGIKAYAEGGSYNVDNEGEEILQYPVYKDDPEDAFWSLVRATIMGKSALPEAQEWVDSGFDSFTAKQTAIYQDLLDAGVSDREAYNTIREFEDIKGNDDQKKTVLQRQYIRELDISDEGKAILYYGSLEKDDKDLVLMEKLTDMGADPGEVAFTLMNIKDAENSADIRNIIAGAKLTDTEKVELYRSKVSDEQDADIAALTVVGLGFDDYLEVYEKRDSLKKDKSIENKGLEFSYWVDSQGYSEKQADAIKACFGDDDAYEKYVDKGLDPDMAYELVDEFEDLEPVEGKHSVAQIQKWRVCVDFTDNVDDQMTALYAVMNATEYQKVAMANDFGVKPGDYVTLKEVLPQYDADGNGSYKQAEITAAIDSLSCTDEMKAVLWQMTVGKNTKWKNNPYSQKIGQRVYEARQAAPKVTDEEESTLEDDFSAAIAKQWAGN